MWWSQEPGSGNAMSHLWLSFVCAKNISGNLLHVNEQVTHQLEKKKKKPLILKPVKSDKRVWNVQILQQTQYQKQKKKARSDLIDSI